MVPRFSMLSGLLQLRLDYRVFGNHDIFHFTSRDMGHYPFYFQRYGIYSRDMGHYPFLLPEIWDTVFNILPTFRDIGLLG